MLRLFSCFVLAALCTFGTFARAENWPQWRGARIDGVSGEKDLPVTWSEEQGIAWKVPMPGPAGSTPVVWGDRIFLTSVDGDDLVLLCYGIDGKQQWRKVVSSGGKNTYRGDEGNNASPSPSTDGNHVWCFFSNGQLACFAVTGEPVWAFNVQERYGKLSIAFGMSGTPVLDGDRLYVQLIHGEGNPKTQESFVVALDKVTGQEIWKHQRISDGRDECEHSYASPILYRDKEREYLLSHGNDYIIAHSLKDGSELWRCGDLNPKGKYNTTLRFVASPVAVPGMIVVPSAKNGPVFCLKPDGSGDITDKESAFYWKKPNGTPDVPSPIIHDGLVYLLRESGNLVVVDAKTGEQLYEKRTVADRHRASPVLADGKLYTCARNGTVSVIKAGREFEILSQNKLEGDLSASPAFANGRIYFRTFKYLYAVGK